MPYQAQFSSTTLYSSSFREDYRSVVTPSPRTFIIRIWVLPACCLEARSLFTQWPKVEKVPFLKRCLGQLCNFLLTLEMREGEYPVRYIWLTKTVHMVENDKTLTKAWTTLTPHPRSPQALQLAHSSFVWNSRLQVSYFTGRTLDNNLRVILKKISFCVSFWGMLRKTSSKGGS